MRLDQDASACVAEVAPGEPERKGVGSPQDGAGMPSVAEALQRAGSLFQAGEWRGAEQLCASILRLHPQQFDAVRLLGIIAAQTQRAPQALELLGRLVAARPDDPVAHNNYANVLRLLRRLDEALRSYERAVQIRPDYAEAHCNRGITLRELGRSAEALQSYERALQLKPDYAKAHCCRGIALHELGRFAEALHSFECTLQLTPGDSEAHVNLGTALLELGRFAEALQSYEHALRLRPDYAEAHSNRGTALRRLRRFEEALQSYERALQLRPDCAESHYNRGAALQDLGRFQEAQQSYEHALQLKPDYAEAHSSRGCALQEQGRFEEARHGYERALRLKPSYAEAYINLGVWHHVRNEPEAAVVNFNRAIEIRPDLPLAYMNRAYAALLAGDFTNGWVDHEWRWKARPQMLDPRYPDRTLWLGRESLLGKTIILRSEQGHGDTLQFSRYAKQVADLGATVIFEVPSELAALLANLEGVSRLVVRGEPLPAFDFHCPLMSLPLAFGTSLSTIPAQVPYLVADRLKTRFWKDSLGPRTKLRVGLVWSGGFRPDQPELWPVNNRRNVPLAKLAALRNADIAFYSLQKGQPAESELTELNAAGWQGPELIDFTASLRDFSDTAALIANLDLVISVDTATAHLAGALAKRVWIMNRFDTCWRWLLDRNDSPWYPTVRLYRQQRAGDWDEVVERIRVELLRTESDPA